MRVNVGKGRVMRCSVFVNLDRMDLRLNGVPLQEMECFKYLGSQVAADGGSEMDVDHVVHRMNEGYKAWGH